MILVGDVGGTNTRFAIAESQGSDWRFTRLQQQATGPRFPEDLARYLATASLPPLEAAAFCGAGPVLQDGSIRLTNAELRLVPAELARAVGLARVVLVNDFAAVAHAIPRLPAGAFAACGGGTARAQSPCVVLGPGTGLGIAIFTPGRDEWVVIPGDGGHADLAPVDDEELAAWQTLRERHGRVSAETVLCGPGLERLHAALTSGESRPASEIAEAAWGGDSGAARTVALFTRWLGRVAGNLALTAGATGGVYLAGGLIPAWGERFDARAFRAAFEDKPPYTDWLRAVPTRIVRHPQPGLYGLAVLAAGR
jgi:glucokinase